MQIHVRRALPRDTGFITQNNIMMALETEGVALDPELAAKGVLAVMENEHAGFYLVAEADGEPCGSLMVTFEWSDWRCGWFWWIQSVMVRQPFRQNGAYRALHQAVCEVAQAMGDVCGIRLYVDAENNVAHQAYRRVGMAETHYVLFEEDWSGLRPPQS